VCLKSWKRKSSMPARCFALSHAVELCWMRLPAKVKHQRGCCPRVASSAATASALSGIKGVDQIARNHTARFALTPKCHANSHEHFAVTTRFLCAFETVAARLLDAGAAVSVVSSKVFQRRSNFDCDISIRTMFPLGALYVSSVLPSDFTVVKVSLALATVVITLNRATELRNAQLLPRTGENYFAASSGNFNSIILEGFESSQSFRPTLTEDFDRAVIEDPQSLVDPNSVYVCSSRLSR
jgi:hypothetical protein